MKAITNNNSTEVSRSVLFNTFRNSKRMQWSNYRNYGL